jgi:hypothetical protein
MGTTIGHSQEEDSKVKVSGKVPRLSETELRRKEEKQNLAVLGSKVICASTEKRGTANQERIVVTG